MLKRPEGCEIFNIFKGAFHNAAVFSPFGHFRWLRRTETPLCAQRSNLVEDLWPVDVVSQRKPPHFVRERLNAAAAA